MKIKVKTITGVSLGVGLIAALLSIVVSLLIGMSALFLIVTPALILISTYFAGRYLFNSFVLYRIKPIYQLILSKNIKTSELDQSDDVVDSIKNELKLWADRNAEEITRLKDNERYRKEFLGNVSHEIRTPIFTIQGYISTLLDGGLEDETINRKYLERSEKSIDRLINIVNDLEQISQLESGTMILEKDRFDLLALVREIAESLEMRAAQRQITLKIGAVGTAVYVYADRKRIGQVLTNLLTNAIRYGREGGRVRVGIIDMFDKVMVEVEDNGVGLSQEDLPRVFERFYRVDRSRSRGQGGTGLGLAIVKHIIEAHAEQITVRSTLGEGSTFGFTIEKR